MGRESRVRVWMAWHGGGDLWTPMLVTYDGDPDPSWLTLARAWVGAVCEFCPPSDERWTWKAYGGEPWDYRICAARIKDGSDG